LQSKVDEWKAEKARADAAQGFKSRFGERLRSGFTYSGEQLRR